MDHAAGLSGLSRRDNEPVDVAAAFLYPDWPRHARRLREAVTGLSDEHLALRAGPGHAPVWALAAHVAGARVYWVCGVFGEPGAELTPWHEPAGDPGWEDDESRPRTAAELAWALDSSWDVVRHCLENWPIGGLEVAAARKLDSGAVQVHSRGSVLNRLFSHDAFHAGEISQVLGTHGLSGVDLWAQRPQDQRP